MHDHLGTLYPGMRAPSFRCTEKDGELLLHYYSERPGLEHIVIGIVKVHILWPLSLPLYTHPFHCAYLSQAVASKLHGVEVEIEIVKRKGEPIDEAEKERALARDEQQLDTTDTTAVTLDAAVCPALVSGIATESASASASATVSASAAVVGQAGAANAETNNNHNGNGLGNNNVSSNSNNNNNDGQQQIGSELGKAQTNCFGSLRLQTVRGTDREKDRQTVRATHRHPISKRPNDLVVQHATFMIQLPQCKRGH